MKRIMSIILVFAAFMVLSACGTSQQSGAGAAAAQQSTMESSKMSASEPITQSQSAAPEEVQQPITTEGLITQEEAKRIALEDAGVNESDVSGVYIHLDWDDGIQEYEVEFYVGTEEYDYEISALDGTIRGKDREVENLFTQGLSTDTEATFTEADAIALVLSKVPGATEDLIRIHLDRDDGILIYEGSLVYEGIEYDFEIHGETGALLEWEAERFDWD